MGTIFKDALGDRAQSNKIWLMLTTGPYIYAMTVALQPEGFLQQRWAFEICIVINRRIQIFRRKKMLGESSLRFNARRSI